MSINIRLLLLVAGCCISRLVFADTITNISLHHVVAIKQLFEQRRYSDVRVEAQRILALPKPRLHDSLRLQVIQIAGNAAYAANDYLSALADYRRGLSLADTLHDMPRRASLLNGMGNIFANIGDRQKALSVYQEALTIREQAGDTLLLALSCNNLGNFYIRLNDTTQALSYHLRALKLRKAVQDEKGIAQSYANLGVIYRDRKEDSTAIGYYRKALTIQERLGNTGAVASIFNNIGNIYAASKFYDEALFYFNQSLKLKRKAGDESGMIVTWNNLGDVFLQTKNYIGADTCFNNALAASRRKGLRDDQKNAHKGLAAMYAAQGRFEEAFVEQQSYILLKDTLYNEANVRSIREMSAKYDIEKKDHEIEILEKDNLLQATRNNRQSIVMTTLSFAVIFVSFFAVYAYRSYRNKQRTNRHLAEMNQEITDSIQYARRIQRALLTSEQTLETVLPAHFIFFRPKDIVSGDFYWAQRKENQVMFCAADCTGHGVPGAFMSLLGITYLENITTAQQIHRPDLVLAELRKAIIVALGNSNDGMDMVICRYDEIQQRLEVSCANSPLWKIRGGQLEELKPDKFPVGTHPLQAKSFSLHTLDVLPGDQFYLFSDGYADQFGGNTTNGKKFKYRQLKEKLISISYCTPAEQKAILEKTFDEWRGTFAQVDDVLVMGIRF